jgi:hypothetical protein
MLWPFYPWGNNPQKPLDYRLGGIQSQSEHKGREKNFCPYQILNPGHLICNQSLSQLKDVLGSVHSLSTFKLGYLLLLGLRGNKYPNLTMQGESQGVTLKIISVNWSLSWTKSWLNCTMHTQTTYRDFNFKRKLTCPTKHNKFINYHHKYMFCDYLLC